MAVAQPRDKAEQSDERIKRSEPESELLALEPLVVAVPPLHSDGAGAAHERHSLKAAQSIRVVRGQRELPHAHGKHARADRSQAKSLVGYALVNHRVWRQFSILPHLHAIPVELVGIVDDRNEQGNVCIGAGRGCDVDGPAIPGKARVTGMALRAPGLVGRELLPVRVVVAGCGPRGVVTQVELPWAVERSHTFAQAVDDERVRASGIGSLCRRRKVQAAGNKRKNGKLQAGEAGRSCKHAANIPRLRWIETA